MNATNRTSTAQAIFDRAFFSGREPRSQAYRRGVLDMLLARLDGAKLACPFRLGTAEADAYFSGGDEGRLLAAQAKLPSDYHTNTTVAA